MVAKSMLNSLYIEWPKSSDEMVKLELLNLNGKTVLQKEHLLSNPLLELKLNMLAEGVYILRMQQEGLIIRKKVVLIK